jgi:dienelactone hydrolase
MYSSRLARSALAAALIVLLAPLHGDAAGGRLTTSKVRLQTSVGSIPADLYEQPGARRRPAILVLHGAGGLLFDGPEMRRVAQALAADGNAVYLVHYFRSTGTLFALDAAMERHFGTWLEVVRSSVTAVRQARGDRSPVGIYGYSLGGFLALRAASDNPAVGAVVEHAGGVWNGRTNEIGRMPAVLMVHGERDGRVPFAKYAQPLVPVLRRRATKLETQFFPEEGHGFAPAAMANVRAEAAGFFRRNLKSE